MTYHDTRRQADRSASLTHAILADAAASLDRSAAILDRLEQAGALPRERLRRSIELARDAQMGAWSCHFVRLERAPDGQPERVIVEVPSTSAPALPHRVSVALSGGLPICDCAAAAYGRGCRHCGAAVLYTVSLVQSFAEAERLYWRSLAHEGNARALGPSL